jgi:hypothetical protein
LFSVDRIDVDAGQIVGQLRGFVFILTLHNVCTEKKKNGQKFYPNTLKWRMLHSHRHRKECDIKIDTGNTS